MIDEGIKAKLEDYLAARVPGCGPALPSSSGRIGFDDSTPIDCAVQQRLEALFGKYLTFLDTAGFPPAKKKVIVQLDTKKLDNTYYDGTRIVIDQRVADDPSVAIREYTHHVLLKSIDSGSYEGQHAAIEGALADYFACSFLKNPKLGERAAAVWKIGKPYIRILRNNRTFSEFASRSPIDIHDGAEIWGGLFWSLREQLGDSVTDKLLATSWQSFKAPKEEGARAVQFVKALLGKSQR